jgi:hypothetical protein
MAPPNAQIVVKIEESRAAAPESARFVYLIPV